MSKRETALLAAVETLKALDGLGRDVTGRTGDFVLSQAKEYLAFLEGK